MLNMELAVLADSIPCWSLLLWQKVLISIHALFLNKENISRTFPLSYLMKTTAGPFLCSWENLTGMTCLWLVASANMAQIETGQYTFNSLLCWPATQYCFLSVEQGCGCRLGTSVCGSLNYLGFLPICENNGVKKCPDQGGQCLYS